MNITELGAVCFHTISNLIGLFGNGLLLYLVIRKTPATIKTYSVLLFNLAFTDCFTCLSAAFVQQRIIPMGTSLAFISSGPCKYFGPMVCFVGYSVMLHCYSHSLWSLLISFIYRYYVLRYKKPRILHLVLILLGFYSISLFQFVVLCFASDDPEQIRHILNTKFPSYATDDHVISGIIDIFEWKTFFTILHMTVPIFPIYCVIIFLRFQTKRLLSGLNLSSTTKAMHSQLLRALTFQALLPILFLIPVISYGLGQTGILNHPILEYSVFIIGGFLPVLSPLGNIYFINSYKNWVRQKLGRMTRVTTAPQTIVGFSSNHDNRDSNIPDIKQI